MFLFTEDSDIANYADDNSIYACEKNMDLAISKIENDSKILLNWVRNNALKANPEKFHLIMSNDDETLSLKIDTFEIFNSKSKKLLGIVIDNNLSFKEHVTGLCKKASQKLHALARVTGYMDLEKRRIIMKAFIISQFGYCPLVWMFHSRTLNNRINKIHERALRLVYKDNDISFSDLLLRDDSVTIHERNIQTLATELFKVVNGLAPNILKDTFPLKDSSMYSSNFPFKTRNVRTVNYGTETLAYLGPKIWAIVPNEIKAATNLIEFKNKIKRWKAVNCPCRLCKIYIAGVGFMNIKN